MKQFGLIGFPLGHSFSRNYFQKKFQESGLNTHQYDNYEIESIEQFQSVVSANKNLCGLNVTIPYKEAVIPFLDELHASAQTVGAVNVIKVSGGKLIGYNSDCYGFRKSLTEWLPNLAFQSLILGTGGASKAIAVALQQLGIEYSFVSRNPSDDQLSYDQLFTHESIIKSHKLIINTSPIGTFPNVEAAPRLPYHLIGANHFLYDLVYNPAETTYMKHGLSTGAKIKNGLRMLELQAERSWEIWTKDGI